jgi:hypothetical protein
MRTSLPDEYVSTLEAAETLGVPHHWIFRMCVRGQLERVQVDGRDVITRESLMSEGARLAAARRVMRFWSPGDRPARLPFRSRRSEV